MLKLTPRRILSGLAIIAGVGLVTKIVLANTGGVKAKRIACFGDSLTAAGIYAKELARLTGVETKAFGYTSKGTKFLLSQVKTVLAWQPDTVVVLAGVNDLPTTKPQDVSGNSAKGRTVTSGLERIYDAFKQAGVQVIAVKLTPWGAYGTFNVTGTKLVNEWIGGEGKKLVDAVVDTSALGVGDKLNLNTAYSADGLHMTAAGYNKLAELIAKKVKLAK